MPPVGDDDRRPRVPHRGAVVGMRGVVAGRGPARRAAVGRARRCTASTLAVVLVASGLGYVAVASQGTTVHEAALNDSGVWVSSDAQAKFARANVPIGQLDAGVATTVAAGSGLDVLQDGVAVVGVAQSRGSSSPSTRAPPPRVTRPPAWPPSLGGGHLRGVPGRPARRHDRPARPRERQGLGAARRPARRHQGPRRACPRRPSRSPPSESRVRSPSTPPAPSTRSAAPTGRSPRCRSPVQSSAGRPWSRPSSAPSTPTSPRWATPGSPTTRRRTSSTRRRAPTASTPR